MTMDAQHPARLALRDHQPQSVPVEDVMCSCGYDGREGYTGHALGILDEARLLMDTRRPFTGPIPKHDPNWANEAHPHGTVGAPGAVPTYAERMGLTNPARPAP
jgi:hypothetical protein